MQDAEARARMREIREAHRRLEGRAAQTQPDDYRAVQSLGETVLEHGAEEVARLAPIWRWVDPAVQEELAAEHASLQEDLQFLAELQQTAPGSEDLRLVAAGLLERLLRHIRRDERTLYQPLARYLEAYEVDAEEPETASGSKGGLV